MTVDEAEGVRFLTMGLVEGRSLDQMLPEFARAWAGQADAYTLLAEYVALSPEEAFPQARQERSSVKSIGP